MELNKTKIEVMRYQRLISLGQNPLVPRIHHQIIRKISYKLAIFKNKIIKKLIKILPLQTSNLLNKNFNKITFALRLNGGIGDIINASAFLNKLYEVYDLPKLDIFNHKPEFVEILLGNAPYINKILVTPKNPDILKEQYNIFLSLSDFCVAFLNLPKKYPSSIALFIKNLKNSYSKKYDFYLKNHGGIEGIFAKEMLVINKNRVSAPGVFVNIEILEDDIKIFYTPKVNKLNLKNYITVHDGCDVTNPSVKNKSTKQWPIEYWNDLILRIKKDYPNLIIVQLGSKFSEPMRNVDYCLVNKTSITEAFDFLAGAKFHIDIESGLVRVAKALGIKSAVIFASTNPDYYKLQDNINIVPNKCGDCGWADLNWMVRCPLGYKQPICSSSIKPLEVFNSIKNFF